MFVTTKKVLPLIVGYAKTTGGISCVYSTSGPGATNLITGIADAYGINSYQVNNIDSFEKLLKDYDKSKPTLIEINLPVGTIIQRLFW